MHINSEVNNKAAYGMTDRDTFNGYTSSSCPATEAPLCGLPQQTHVDLFFDDIKSGSDN